MPDPHRLMPLAGLLAAAMLLAGCGEREPSPDSASAAPAAAASLPDDLFLSAAPDAPQPIRALKQSATQGDEVTVRAVVGGSVNPIVEDRALATLVDAGMNNTCVADDDHCRTPWDYCCEPREQLTANMATLQVVDADGRVVEADLSQHIQPLSTVVVRGVVGPRPTAAALTINATGIYVESREQP